MPHQDGHLNHRKNTQKFAQLYVTASSPFLVIFYMMGFPTLSMSALPFLGGFVVALILTKYGYERLAKATLILVSNWAILFFATLCPPEAGFQLAFFGICMTPFAIFSKKEKPAILGSILISLTCYYLVFYQQLTTVPAMYLAETQSQMLFLALSMVTFTFLTMGGFFFLTYYEQAETEKAAKQEKEKQILQVKAENLAHQATFATLTRGIAHEIRNPMSMIMAGADLIVHHQASMEGHLSASAAFPHHSPKYRNPWNNLLHGRNALDFINDPDAIEAGLGYEEMEEIMLHKDDAFDENGYAKYPEKLKKMIKKHWFLSKEEFDYDKADYKAILQRI